MHAVPEVVRRRALRSGAADWLDALPSLVAQIERDWSLRVGRAYSGGTEAFVADVECGDGRAGVVKLLIPREGTFDSNEITALRIADGRGCPALWRHDGARGALLMERLGPSMFDLGLPIAKRHASLCAAARRVWRPAPDCGLPTGRAKAQGLIERIAAAWEELARPCSERAVDHAIRCAQRRSAAHDDERAVLVHGDVHQWNALRCGRGFKLVDPDGLLAEREYDLGIVMREDPVELLRGDPMARARRLARLGACDGQAVWDWGVVERVSTGLDATRIGLQPAGRDMLRAADELAA